MTWELVHRLNALIIGVFIVCHLGVHLLAVASPEAHSDGLAYMRQFYFDPRYEIVLLASVFLQVYSGYAELTLYGKSGWRLVRNISGAYLIMFMVIHVGMVLYARHITFVPTDFHWVAGSIARDPTQYFIATFYGLGVFSVFGHMIAVLAMAWTKMPRKVLAISWALGIATTGLIVFSFSGVFYQIVLPDESSAGFRKMSEPLLNVFGTD